MTAAHLEVLAAALRRVPATGATVHDLRALIGLADGAAKVARDLEAGTAIDAEWWRRWLDNAVAELAVYQADGLEGWRRVYRRR